MRGQIYYLFSSLSVGTEGKTMVAIRRAVGAGLTRWAFQGKILMHGKKTMTALSKCNLLKFDVILLAEFYS